MFDVYCVQLPRNYAARIMFFESMEKAKEVCAALQKDHPVGASSGYVFEPVAVCVLEDEDIKVLATEDCKDK